MYRFMAEEKAAVEKHLTQVPQGQPIAQAPQQYQRNDIGRVLRPVQHPGTALVELFTAVAAPETPVTLGGALRPLRHHRGAAAHAFRPRIPAHPPA
jgi:hypothetical protein